MASCTRVVATSLGVEEIRVFCAVILFDLCTTQIVSINVNLSVSVSLGCQMLGVTCYLQSKYRRPESANFEFIVFDE